MRLTLTAFGHTLTIDTAIGCPDHGEPEREVDLNGTIVEHADPYPDPRAELDARVRHEAFGFCQCPDRSRQ